jgi:hypothetical protein
VFVSTPKRPPALEDPLLAIRTFYGFLLTLQLFIGLCCTAIGLLSDLPIRERAELLKTAVSVIVSIPILLAFRRVLPNRPTNALYLRSFSQDGETGAIRTALQRAFGPGFRLSGIRDPRRRWPKVLRYFSVFAFAFRYATPKYMNLEAGTDWKRRLWSSLGDVRCAVIDVTDLTPFVIQEIKLCATCLGFGRILFVIDSRKAVEDWGRDIHRALDWAGATDDFQLAVWDASRAGREAFDEAVVKFTATVPKEPAGFRPDAAAVASDNSLNGEPESRDPGVWNELVVGTVAATAFAWVLEWTFENPDLGFLRLVALIPVVALFLASAYHFIVYVRDCGSKRERVLASLSMCLALLPSIALVPGLIWATSKVRDYAQRMRSQNNLKQIGLAAHSYHDVGNGLPAANATYADGFRKRLGPAVSWRVLLLPYLEENAVFRQYRFDEPWDGPNNKLLIERMPKVYRHPAVEKTPPGYTHYRVFVSPTNAHPSAAFTNGERGHALNDLTDGTSNTLLVVEAAEAVPWTKPDELVFEPGTPLPKLGGHFRGGFYAVTADGTIRFIRDSTPESTLRALITRNGGEAIADY